MPVALVHDKGKGIGMPSALKGRITVNTAYIGVSDTAWQSRVQPTLPRVEYETLYLARETNNTG